MMFIDLLVLIVIASIVSIWLDRRYIRKKKDNLA